MEKHTNDPHSCIKAMCSGNPISWHCIAIARFHAFIWHALYKQNLILHASDSQDSPVDFD